MVKLFLFLFQLHNYLSMSNKNEIYHSGIIKSINGNKIEVSIIAKSACSSCHSKSMCSMSEMEEKIIEIYNFKENKYNLGDNVEVVMNLSMGNKAVFLGYGIPFVLLLSSLIITYNITNSEAISGIVVILSLGIYYFLLSLFRKKLQNTFSFRIK